MPLRIKSIFFFLVFVVFLSLRNTEFRQDIPHDVAGVLGKLRLLCSVDAGVGGSVGSVSVGPWITRVAICPGNIMKDIIILN